MPIAVVGLPRDRGRAGGRRWGCPGSRPQRGPIGRTAVASIRRGCLAVVRVPGNGLGSGSSDRVYPDATRQGRAGPPKVATIQWHRAANADRSTVPTTASCDSDQACRRLVRRCCFARRPTTLAHQWSVSVPLQSRRREPCAADGRPEGVRTPQTADRQALVGARRRPHVRAERLATSDMDRTAILAEPGPPKRSVPMPPGSSDKPVHPRPESTDRQAAPDRQRPSPGRAVGRRSP
jgi:hypothetical protein